MSDPVVLTIQEMSSRGLHFPMVCSANTELIALILMHFKGWQKRWPTQTPTVTKEALQQTVLK